MAFACPWQCMVSFDDPPKVSCDGTITSSPNNQSDAATTLTAPGKTQHYGVMPQAITRENKSFAQAVKNVCAIPVSQLPHPCIKGNQVAIKIPEDGYQRGLLRCKTHLHGRLILSKGDAPIRIKDLRAKISSLWPSIGFWSVTPLGKGFYEFSFETMEDQRKVLAAGSWNLKPGILRLFPWSKDFNPSMLQNSNVQCWVRFISLSQEYWDPSVIFSIARSIGTPLCLDETTATFTLGYFARVLIDFDIKGRLPSQVLVEREGFAFFVDVEFENLPPFCNYCHTIGHLVDQCRKKGQARESVKEKDGVLHPSNNPVKPKKVEFVKQMYVPKEQGKPIVVEDQPVNDKQQEEQQGVATGTSQISSSPRKKNDAKDDMPTNSEVHKPPGFENILEAPIRVDSQSTPVHAIDSGSSTKVPESTAELEGDQSDSFPEVVRRDLSILSKYWANDLDHDNLDKEVDNLDKKVDNLDKDNLDKDGFKVVISKSQKYNLRKNRRINVRFK